MQLIQIQTRNALGHGLNLRLNGPSSRTSQLHKRRFSHSTDATVFLENDDEISIIDLNEADANNIVVGENISELLSSTSTVTERKRKRRRFEPRCAKSSNMLVKDVGDFLRQHFTEKENNNDENNKSTESLIEETVRLMKSIKLTSSYTRSTE